MKTSSHITDNQTSELSAQACVSIVVSNHDRCIGGLLKPVFHDNRGEAVLVDGNSKTSNVEPFEKLFSKVQIHQRKKNLGYTFGNDPEAKQIDWKYIVTLYSNTNLGPNCVRELSETFADDDNLIPESLIFIPYDGQPGIICPRTVFIWPEFLDGYEMIFRPYPRNAHKTGPKGGCFRSNRDGSLHANRMGRSWKAFDEIEP